MIAEEEAMEPEERQLALRPADMTFEQAMLHYMAQMNERQVASQAATVVSVNAVFCCARLFLDGLILDTANGSVCVLTKAMKTGKYSIQCACTLGVCVEGYNVSLCNCRVQDMAEDMAEIRKEIVRMQRPRRPHASTRSFVLSPYTWLIGSTLVAASSYCCFVYLKPSRGSSQLL